MGKLNIIEFGLARMSNDYKRNFFYQLDAQLKRIHQNGGIVRNFSPKYVYIDTETRTPAFQIIYPSSSYFFDIEDQRKAQVEDIQMLACLSFCVYLSGEEAEYCLENGLLQFEVLKNNWDFIVTYLPEEDIVYYKQIFNSTIEDELSYYSDYIDQRRNIDGALATSRALSKSTEAGRAMAGKDSEAAYVNYILTFSIVGILTMFLIFIHFLLFYS